MKRKQPTKPGNLYEAVINYLQFKNQCEREQGKEPQITLPELPDESRARINAAVENLNKSVSEYVNALIAESRQGGKA